MERNSVELWDFPMAWPPTTHFAVLALLRCRTAETTKAARKIADGFITTAYNGLLHTRRGMVRKSCIILKRKIICNIAYWSIGTNRNFLMQGQKYVYT
jgi:neutral trehalase